MWREIKTKEDIDALMNTFGAFHDSCLKELVYISGSYVNDDCSMKPTDDLRIVRVIFQRQYRNPIAIELEFSKLVILNLSPAMENHSSDIYNASFFWEGEYIYWADSKEFTEYREGYDGTWVCARKARWRPRQDAVGSDSIYQIDNELI